MPLLQIVTNVPQESVPPELFGQLTDLVAAEFDRPKQFVMIQVLAGKAMTFGGSAEPSASVTIFAIGRLGVEENKRYSKAIMESLHKHLGIEPTRCFIFFNEYEPSFVGHNKSTFDGLV